MNTPARRAERVLAWLAPALFVLFPILSTAAGNRAELGLNQLVRPVAVLETGAAALMALLILALRRDPRNAGLMVCGFAFLVFGYYDTSEVLNGFLAMAVNLPSPASGVLPIWGVALVALETFLWRLRNGRDHAVRTLAVMGAVLCVQPAWTLLQAPPPVESDLAARLADTAPTPSPRPIATVASVKTPDIYFIILDAYGRGDALKHFYRYDNAPFLDALTQRGFHVARHSQANYTQTVLALAAALNLDYLQNLKQGPTQGDAAAASPLINDSRVERLLRRRGYHIVSVPTGMPLTAMEGADLTLMAAYRRSSLGLNELEELLLARTPLGLIPRRDTSDFAYHRQRIEYAFDALPKAAALPYPKLVFAHILAPHPPFVFDADGRPVDPPGSAFTLTDASGLRKKFTEQQYRDAYVAQLRYVNRRLLQAVDGIRASATRPAVVIVQGDHGSRMLLDWYSADRTDPAEFSRNLTAILLPDAQPGDAAAIDTLSPVNTFRFVLGTRFGMKLPLLPNHSWYSGVTDTFRFQPIPDATATLP